MSMTKDDKQKALDGLRADFAKNNESAQRGNDNADFAEDVFVAKVTSARMGEKDGKEYAVYNFTVDDPNSANNGLRGTEFGNVDHPVGFEIFMTSMSKAGLDCSLVEEIPDQMETLVGQYFEIKCKRSGDWANFQIYSPVSGVPKARSSEVATAKSDPQAEEFSKIYDDENTTLQIAVSYMKKVGLRKVAEASKLIEAADIEGLLLYIAQKKGFATA